MFWRLLWKILRASRGRLAVALIAVVAGAAVCSALVNLHLDAERWYATVVDATTGELLFSQNLYRQDRPQGLVFGAPATPNPSAGPPTLEPFTGWPSTETIRSA